MIKKYAGMILRLIVAVLLLWWVMRDLDFSSLAKLSKKGLLIGAFGSFFLIALQTTFTALRWKILLAGQGIHLTFFRAVSLTFQGCMFSLFMPGGAVGGDVLKAAFLTREAKKGSAVEGVTTIFLDRVIGMLGLFGLVLILGACSLGTIRNFPGDIRWLVYILLLTSACGFAAGCALLYQDLFFRIPLFAFLLRKADVFTKGALTRILRSVEVCRRGRKRLLIAFLMSLLILHPLLLSCGCLILYGISDQKTIAVQVPFTAVALGNVASTAPVSPGGLGTRDKVTEVVLRSFGVPAALASLVPLIYSCAYVTVGLTGILFFLGDSFHKKKEQNL